MFNNVYYIDILKINSWSDSNDNSHNTAKIELDVLKRTKKSEKISITKNFFG